LSSPAVELDDQAALRVATPRTTSIRVAMDAHTIGRRASGNETYVRGLMRGLMEHGDIALTVLLDRMTPPPVGLRGVEVGTLRFSHPIPRLAADLARAGRRWRADLLHVQYVRPLTSDVPVVNTIHDISFERFPRFFRPTTLARLRTLVPWSGRHSAAVVTVSEFSRQDLLERYRLNPEAVFVTPAAADPQFRPVPAPEASQVVRSLGLPDRFILSVGDIQPRKNLPRLFAAYDLLLQRGMDVPDLVVVGKRAWLNSGAFGSVARHRLEKRIRFTGYVAGEALPALYSSADAFVYPSLFEGFGLPILEALACGAPTITSNVSSMPEVAGDAALLVNPESVEELADGIERVLGDSGLRADLVARGHARAGEFSWARTASRTVEAYAYALSRTP
jgi:glycosyltransferase involved in cell wall biosynthesis